MAKTFNLTTEERSGCLWITFHASIDMDNCKAFEESIAGHIQNTALHKIVFDLSKTAALFSSGLGLIMRMHRLAENNGRNIFLVNVTEKMREGLCAMNLDRILAIYPTAEACIAAHGVSPT